MIACKKTGCGVTLYNTTDLTSEITQQYTETTNSVVKLDGQRPHQL